MICRNRSISVRKLCVLGSALATVMSCVSTHAADASSAQWPQWRGPDGGGIAPLGDPPVEWSETNNVRWKSLIPGLGTSTPVVWDNHVFILTAVEVDSKTPPASDATTNAATARPAPGKPTTPLRFITLDYDRRDGKILWQKTVCEEVPHEGHHKDHGYASGSPVTDGENVYSFFGSRGLYCHDFKGNLKWEKRFGQMKVRNAFGEGSSPALFGNTLVVVWDHEGEDFIVALNKTNGDEIWRKKRDAGTGWTTPLIVQRGSRTEVMVSAENNIISYDLATGEELWKCRGMTANPIPTPSAGKDRVWFNSGFRGNSLMAIKLGGSGDLTGTDSVLWKHDRNCSYVPSALVYEDRIYFFASCTAKLSCLDAMTGKPDYEAETLKDISGIYASPVGAAGRVYVAGRNGKCAVIKAGPKLEVLSLNTLDEQFDASPAIVGRDLFLRGHKTLYCIGTKP
jgi:outer membrane protein assembly factor BamB